MGLMEFIFMVMMEEQKHNEMKLSSLLLLKIGVVVALSFGFLFTRRRRRLKNQRIHRIRSLPLQSLSSHSGAKKIDYLDGSFELKNYVETLEEANEGLRKENFELAKEIDRLEANQCAFYEEQVYLKWLNACLRYEVRNYKAPPGKTMARDLNNNMSPKSHEKAKQLVLEYTNSEEKDANKNNVKSMDFESGYWSSSQTTSPAAANKNNVKSMDFESGYWSSSQTTSPAARDSAGFENRIIDVSSAMKPKRWNKVKILSRVKRILALQKSHYNSSNRQ